MIISDKIIRSATLENMADKNGVVLAEKLGQYYTKLSAKTIITGFVYVSKNGRAMQQCQAGIVTDEQVESWRKTVQYVRSKTPDKILMMQLAHCGRQTTRPDAVGPSKRSCSYFKTKVKQLTNDEIKQIIDDFANAALKAQEIGFNGVQIHAAHGYLIHQFLSAHTNRLSGKYADGVLFLIDILKAIREKCKPDFKVWIKISAVDDRGVTLKQTMSTLRRTDHLFDAVEISYGTMEYPLNIIRGSCPIDVVLKINPLFNKYPRWLSFFLKKFYFPHYLKRFKPFQENYNLEYARQIKQCINKPVFVTGGIRSLTAIKNILSLGIDGICLCRPFIAEPDLITKIENKAWEKSTCINCNLCAVLSDGIQPVRCWQKGKNDEI